MKKYILLMSLALLLGGCGKQVSDMQESVDEESTTEIEDLDSTADTETEDLESIADTETDTDTTIGIGDDIVQEDSTDIHSASFSTVLEISNEIAGKYVLYGTDDNGNWCCGLLDENGDVQVYPEYIGLYPLENGKLLVTDDVKVWEDSIDPIDMNLASECKIIDQNGNVLWEKEPNQNIWIVNSKRIFIVSAEGGFDGTTSQWGVIDENGDWVYPMQNNGEMFLEKIHFNDDRITWNFPQAGNEKFGGGADIAIIDNVALYIRGNRITGGEASDQVFLYWPSSDQMCSMDLYANPSNLRALAEDKILGVNENALADYKVYCDNGEVEKIKLPLIGAGDFIRDHGDGNLYYKDIDGAVGRVTEGGSIDLTDFFFDKTAFKMIDISNEKIICQVTGDDGLPYLVLINAEDIGKETTHSHIYDVRGNVIDVLLKENYLTYVYVTEYAGKGICTLNLDNGEIEYETIMDSETEVQVLDGKYLIFRNEMSDWGIELYDHLGNRIV